MNKALFLDRDGVLVRERGEYTYRTDQFEVLPDVAEALKQARDKGYMLIVISNQGGIAKGIFTQQQVELLHEMMCAELARSGVQFDEIYYCPHHSDVGKCICRKPDSGMLEKALARFRIDPGSSLMIGDSERDVLAAQKVGIPAVQIASNSGILSVINDLK